MKGIDDVHGRVLVADDEKLNVEFFQVMLDKLGFEVDVALDGEEALQKVKQFSPDLILLDLLMPKVSGFRVAQRLKSDPRTKNIPIIVLTAVHDIKDKVDMIELGIEDYITKPFNFVEILARIRNNLRAKFLRDEMESREGEFRAAVRLRGALDSFLREARDYSDKIHERLAVLKRSGAGQGESILQLEGDLNRLLSGIDVIREACATVDGTSADGTRTAGS
jgi:DNA-binding response OmpR family regulator